MIQISYRIRISNDLTGAYTSITNVVTAETLPAAVVAMQWDWAEYPERDLPLEPIPSLEWLRERNTSGHFKDLELVSAIEVETDNLLIWWQSA